MHTQHIVSIALVAVALGCSSKETMSPAEEAPDSAIDTVVAADTNTVADTGVEDISVADTSAADTSLEDSATADTGGADTAIADTEAADTADAAPAAVCGDGVIESGEACEPVSMSGLTSDTAKVAKTFNDVNHCSLRCGNIIYSSFGTDITKLGPAFPADLALDRVLYARVPSNNWNPTGGYGAYDYRQYYRITLSVKTRLDIYSMAANVFEDGKWFQYTTSGTLYTSMELFTIYASDKTARVGGFPFVRGNPDASPPYAAKNTIELPAGTYYLAIATPYWTTSKPTAFTVYSYLEQHPM